LILRRAAWRTGLATAWLACVAAVAWGQVADVQDRPIAEVRIEGARQVDEQLIRNQITQKAGDAYDARAAAQDIANINRLGRFSYVGVQTSPNPDGSVAVTYTVRELSLLSDVQVVGNKKKSDRELLNAVMLKAGDARDDFLIQQAREKIREIYHGSGYFLADVSVDPTLDETGILILRIREGPRIKVRVVEFEGNSAFPDELLESRVKTNTYFFIFRKGLLSKEQLDEDEARLRDYYVDRGYLDVRVGRTVVLSDDQKDAAVRFVIDEGRQYTIRTITFEGHTVYPAEQLRQAMTFKVGDVYSPGKLTNTGRGYITDPALQDLYGKLGRIETVVRVERVFHPTEPMVDLKVTIGESKPYTVGAVIIRGNELTQDKVYRRHVRGIEPGRRFDSTGIARTEQRIRQTGLVDQRQPEPVKVTILGEPQDDVRDALIEVKEGPTGSLSFGAAVSSDSGLFGAIDLTQRNFDITDVPESWGEFFSGRAFRGAGQYFAITLQPGNEFQRYQVSFREPYIFDSDYFLDTNAFYFTRIREKWNEERFGGTIGLGKRFGDVWSASVRTRMEQVTIDELDDDAPIDAFAVEGDSVIDSVGFYITRSTVTDRFFPTEGTRWTAGIERVGLLSSDYDFTRLSTEFDIFITVDEDFFGRKTVLSFSLDMGWIPDADEMTVTDDMGGTHSISETPLFERFYAGGHRSFRGFEFRGVGPRGIRQDNGMLDDDPVGGNWQFLFGTEYNFPIYENFLRGVLFIDSGTVQEDFGFDEYRVSVGGGIRLNLPFFGQAPFAFDLAYPLLKEEGDETRIFSFDIALPF
jgi:outer membrane protein insertion porin family